MSDILLDRRTILEALRRVGLRLLAQDKRADVFVFGGAVMVLAYQARPATRDVNAIYEPDTEVHNAAVAVAEEMGLPRHWLNNQASVYLAAKRSAVVPVLLDAPGIRVSGASMDLVLAMKMASARGERDADDAAWLLRKPHIRTSGAAMVVYERFFPGIALPERQRLWIDDVVQGLDDI